MALPKVFTPPKSVGDAVASVLFGVIALVPLAFMVILALSPKPGSGAGAMIAAVVALLLGAPAWFWWRRSRDQRSLLTLTDAGVEAPHLSHPLRWDDIDDAELDERSGATLLRFKTASGNVVVKLHRLKRGDRTLAFDTVHQVIAERRRRLGLGETATAKQLRESAEFEEMLAKHTPRVWALHAVVALNVLVWAATVLAGLSPLRPAPDQLFQWGANSASAVVLDGQVWRLLTATFLHAGVVHLAFNMLGLWEGGKQLVRMLGNGQFLLVYLACALCGSVASLHFSAQQAVSVGASGAVFGVLGALLAVTWRYQDHVPALRSSKLWSGLGVFMFYSLVQGFANQGVDNAAHVGGLACGAACGLMLAATFDDARRGAATMQAVLVGLIAAAAIATGVLATPVPATWHRQMFAAQREFQLTAASIERMDQRLRDLNARHAKKELNEVQLIEAVKTQVLPECGPIEASLSRVAAPQWEPSARMAVQVRRLCGLLGEMTRLASPGENGNVVVAEGGQQRWNELPKEISASARAIREIGAGLVQKKAPR
ncbi:MAG: rhomboid family intramembrane serine protease [Pseudomonadota bacterium]